MMRTSIAAQPRIPQKFRSAQFLSKGHWQGQDDTSQEATPPQGGMGEWPKVVRAKLVDRHYPAHGWGSVSSCRRHFPNLIVRRFAVSNKLDPTLVNFPCD